MILSQVDTILQQIRISGFTKPIIIGVSGGPDSLCLLDVLHHSGCALIVAHLNHGLRPEADAEACLVEETAHTIGVEVVVGKEDVPKFARENKLSIEEAARILRYKFLFLQARLHDAEAVAVAHNADDQVETIMMHLLRGSGLSGLKGMSFVTLPNPWSQDIPLIRPLLSSWRQEIVQYCQEHDLHPIQDKSNQDVTYYRNRLRRELIPLLENYNPQVRKILWRTAQTLAGDDEILDQAVTSAWKDCVKDQGSGYIAFQQTAILSQGKGMQRRLVRGALDRLRPGLRDLDYETVERAVDFITSPSKTATLSLVEGIYLLLEADRLWMAVWNAELPDFDWPQIPAGVELSLAIPGEISLPHGWRLKAEWAGRAALPLSFQSNQNTFQAWVSAECLQLPLLVRSRSPGDRFQPLGMAEGTVKLSDLMINAKLPRRARPAWPLVCSKGMIIWIPGRQISHQVRVVDTTLQVVYLQLYESSSKENGA